MKKAGKNAGFTRLWSELLWPVNALRGFLREQQSFIGMHGQLEQQIPLLLVVLAASNVIQGIVLLTLFPVNITLGTTFLPWWFGIPGATESFWEQSPFLFPAIAMFASAVTTLMSIQVSSPRWRDRHWRLRTRLFGLITHVILFVSMGQLAGSTSVLAWGVFGVLGALHFWFSVLADTRLDSVAGGIDGLASMFLGVVSVSLMFALAGYNRLNGGFVGPSVFVAITAAMVWWVPQSVWLVGFNSYLTFEISMFYGFMTPGVVWPIVLGFCLEESFGIVWLLWIMTVILAIGVPSLYVVVHHFATPTIKEEEEPSAQAV